MKHVAAVILTVSVLSSACAMRSAHMVAASPPPAEEDAVVVAITPATAIAGRDRQVGFLNERLQFQQKRKVGGTYVGMIIAGTVLGVGGGIVGLTVDEEDAKTAGSITSLVSGGLTGLITSLGLDRRAKEREACQSLLQQRVAHMRTAWDDLRFHASVDTSGHIPNALMAAYDADVKQTTELLAELKCS